MLDFKNTLTGTFRIELRLSMTQIYLGNTHRNQEILSNHKRSIYGKRSYKRPLELQKNMQQIAVMYPGNYLYNL